MAQRCIRKDTERRLGIRALGRPSISLADAGGQEADDTFGRVLQVFEGFAAAASFQSHDECEERAALTNPEVIPEILLVVHFEARRALLAQGREIHAVAVSFVPGQNAAAGNTKELAAMLSNLMKSPEGMAIMNRINDSAKK